MSRSLVQKRIREAARKESDKQFHGTGLMPMQVFGAGASLISSSGAGIDVKAVGPTSADTTFFQSVRLKLANNPLSEPFLQHPVLYACVHALAANCANTQYQIRPSVKEKAKPVQNELSVLFDDPNPLMSTADYFYFISLWLSLSGECLVIKEGKNERIQSVTETPAELWPLNGRLFTHHINPKTRLIDYWVLNENSPDAIVYKPHEVIHIRYANPKIPYRGLPPLAAVSQSLTNDWMAMLYGESFFKNGGDPGGILTMDSVLSDTKRQELEERWADRHVGANKAKRLAVLDRGMKYQAISTSQKDMEFVEQRKWNRNEILMAYRVPPAEAGIYEDVNYATAKEESKRFWTRTMFPIFRVIEDAHWHGLFRYILDGRYVGRYDRDSIPEIQVDLSDQLDMAEKLSKLGFTPAQIAAKVGLDMEINPWQNRAWTMPNQTDYATLDESLTAAYESESTVDPKTSFNGAQVSSAKDIVLAVAAGLMGPEAAIAMLIQFFPGITKESAETMIHSAKPSGPAVINAPQQALPSGPAAPAIPDPSQPAGATVAVVVGATTGSLSGRTSEDRRNYWKALHESHYGPEEPKFQGMVRRWMLGMRAEQLALIDSHPKAFKNGQICLLLKDDGATKEAPETIIFDADKWRAKIGEASRPHYKRVVLAAQKRLATEIGSSIEWGPDDPKVETLTESLGSRITSITETVRSAVRESLGKVIANGGSVRDAQKAVKEVFKVSLSRSLTIARTEVGGASNRASYLAMRECGVQKVEWVSAGDGNVREEHQIDGEVIEVGETFSNGLHFPHDPEGDADEIINCRCDIAPVVDYGADGEDEDEDEIYQEVDV